jgi:hypothetical protein
MRGSQAFFVEAGIRLQAAGIGKGTLRIME